MTDPYHTDAPEVAPRNPDAVAAETLLHRFHALIRDNDTDTLMAEYCELLALRQEVAALKLQLKEAP